VPTSDNHRACYYFHAKLPARHWYAASSNSPLSARDIIRNTSFGKMIRSAKGVRHASRLRGPERLKIEMRFMDIILRHLLADPPQSADRVYRIKPLNPLGYQI
jgi:hypothetical protein